MDKNKEYFDSQNHSISINERKSIMVYGVKKINSFDDTEFFVDSIKGPIIIKGESLELLKLDTFQGSLSIKGIINSVCYLDSTKKSKRRNI